MTKSNKKKENKKQGRKTDWSKATSLTVEKAPTIEAIRDRLEPEFTVSEISKDSFEVEGYTLVSKKELQELKDQIPVSIRDPEHAVINGFSIVEDARYGVFVDGDIIKHEKIDVLSCTKYLRNLVFIISNPGRPVEPDTSEVLFTSSEPEERKWHCPIHSPATDCDHIKVAKAWAIEEDVIRVETIEVPDEA